MGPERFARRVKTPDHKRGRWAGTWGHALPVRVPVQTGGTRTGAVHVPTRASSTWQLIPYPPTEKGREPPVYAVLNKSYRQKFFIDTGATTTIIPAAAAAALGIRIDDTTPVVGLQGVAGSDLAYQVRLESIEIERQTVFDIRAIVYDLGEDENAGLLGNDFLQSFQVDLDSIKGVLKLRKR